jgi:hypothetical protein
VRVAYHKYSLAQMELYIHMVLHASVSLRGSSRVLGIVWNFMAFEGPVPGWSCGRLWLLRLGYFKLTRAKEKASDWVWICDHTIQIGSEKFLVILGIRLSSMPQAGKCLSYEDMEPLAIIPAKESNGPIVAQQLEETIALTGVPRQIIADCGPDLTAGIKTFCEKHPQTCAVYDIKHKTATLLKRELKDDERWKSFCEQCTQTASKVRQTDLAFLEPPSQRAKARYMNLGELIDWGKDALIFVDAGGSAKGRRLNPSEVEAKLGWIKTYRKDISEWEALWTLMGEAESFVRKEGLYRGARQDLKDRLRFLAPTEQTKRIRRELISFVAWESRKAKAHERLLGSSEIIESVFGKLKSLEKNQANSGFTALVLSLAAIVSKTTSEVIRTAMETVHTNDVIEWCRKKLGTSVQAKRKIFLSDKSPEQKWEEIDAALAS